MLLQLVGLEIHFRVEDDELFLLAFLVQAREVIFAEMLLKRIIVDIVLRVVAASPSVTQMAPLVTFSAMSKQLVISIESLSTKAAFRVALKT